MMDGLQIRMHPTLDLLVRSDGAILLKNGWTFGASGGKNHYKRCKTANGSYYIHRLVAEAFLTTVPGKPFVDHIDRNKSNNFVQNLRYVTVKENVANSSHVLDLKLGVRYVTNPKLYMKLYKQSRKQITQ